jgi:hypothetical protein
VQAINRVYTDLLQHVQKLSLDEAGAVFIAILNYSATGENTRIICGG